MTLAQVPIRVRASQLHSFAARPNPPEVLRIKQGFAGDLQPIYWLQARQPCRLVHYNKFFTVSNELAPIFHVFKLLMVECNRRILSYIWSICNQYNGMCKAVQVVFFSFLPHFCIKVTLFCLTFPVLFSYVLSIIVRSTMYKTFNGQFLSLLYMYLYKGCMGQVAKLLVEILQSYKVC